MYLFTGNSTSKSVAAVGNATPSISAGLLCGGAKPLLRLQRAHDDAGIPAPIAWANACRRLAAAGHVQPLTLSLLRWHRLDVAPFLALYAAWAVWAVQLLATEGLAKWTLLQLATYAVLALHVSWRGRFCQPQLDLAFLHPACVHGVESYVTCSLNELSPKHSARSTVQRCLGAAVPASSMPCPGCWSPTPLLTCPACQALTYLGTVWSVELKSRLHFCAVRRLADATHVKVVPHSFVGTKDIVALHGKQTVSPEAASRELREQRIALEPPASTAELMQALRIGFLACFNLWRATCPAIRMRALPSLSLRCPQEAGPIISFDFRKLHFILDPEDFVFRKLKYPTKARAFVDLLPLRAVGAVCMAKLWPPARAAASVPAAGLYACCAALACRTNVTGWSPPVLLLAGAAAAHLPLSLPFLSAGDVCIIPQQLRLQRRGAAGGGAGALGAQQVRGARAALPRAAAGPAAGALLLLPGFLRRPLGP